MIFVRTLKGARGTRLARVMDPLRVWSITKTGGGRADAHPGSGHGVRLYVQCRFLRRRHPKGCVRPEFLLSRSWRGLTRVASLFGAAMLTACAVGPDFRVPDLPPVKSFLFGGDRGTGVRLVPDSDVPAQWWALFRSRYLNDLIEQGITHNPDLQAAEAAVRAAQANALAQRGALFPTVTAEYNPIRQKTPTEALSSNAATGASTYSLHTAQVSVAYVADVFGGTRRLIEATDAQVDAQAFQR